MAILIGLLLPDPPELLVVVVELDDEPQADAMNASPSVATTMDRFAREDFKMPTPQGLTGDAPGVRERSQLVHQRQPSLSRGGASSGTLAPIGQLGWCPSLTCRS